MKIKKIISHLLESEKLKQEAPLAARTHFDLALCGLLEAATDDSEPLNDFNLVLDSYSNLHELDEEKNENFRKSIGDYLRRVSLRKNEVEIH
jgi:hypothetical protein